jgi:hypothetical protein
LQAELAGILGASNWVILLLTLGRFKILVPAHKNASDKIDPM